MEVERSGRSINRAMASLVVGIFHDPDLLFAKGLQISR